MSFFFMCLYKLICLFSYHRKEVGFTKFLPKSIVETMKVSRLTPCEFNLLDCPVSRITDNEF